MGILSSIFSKGASDLAATAFKGLDGLITSKEELGAQTVQLSEIKSELKQAEMEHKIKAKEIEFQMSEQEFKDRSSARDMQVKTKSKIPGILALVFTIFYFLETAGILAMVLNLLAVDLPNYSVALISGLWGSTSTIEVQIIAFYFGSSQSSEDQSENMGQVVRQAAAKEVT